MSGEQMSCKARLDSADIKGLERKVFVKISDFLEVYKYTH